MNRLRSTYSNRFCRMYDVCISMNKSHKSSINYITNKVIHDLETERPFNCSSRPEGIGIIPKGDIIESGLISKGFKWLKSFI